MPDDGDNVVTLRPADSKPGGTKRGKRAGSAVGPASGAKALTAEQKTARAVELRLRNYTLQRIADEVGYADPSGAWHAIMRGLAAELPEAQRDQLRRIEIAKLNALEEAHQPAATLGEILRDDAGDPLYDSEGHVLRYRPDEKAARIVLSCIDRRSKLLGLDAPQQVTLSTREGEPVEVNVTHSLDAAFVQAAELVRSRIVQQSIERAGDVVDVTPTDPV